MRRAGREPGNHSFLRERMVRDLEARGIRDRRVLEAMLEVPRHRFVRDHLQGQAYGDHALPIGGGQTVSQPYVVARMSELLAVGPEHSVLEVGTGTGYQTAVLARLARRVYSLERLPDLAREAIARMRQLGLENVKIQAFDGTVGWTEVAPFDRILVTAAAPRVPAPLLAQLGEGGRMVIPEGGVAAQRLTVYIRARNGIRRRQEESVAFVPLVGRHGWPEEKD